VIGESGESASTKEMVDEVARQRARNPERAERTFDAIGTLVTNGRLAVEAGDLRALGQLFDLNQQLLAGLMLSTRTLEEMCGAAREAGALGAKLTGGGGGGCMIALASSDEEASKVAAAIEALGKQARVVRAGGSA
jgi:mevalonate kinase